MREPASALLARAWKQARDPSAALLATQLVSIVLRLGSNLVLAHLLIPRDFGLLAITTLVATALAMMSETGVWVSIVRKGQKIDRNWLDQLWTLQAIRGVILWFIALTITPAIAKAYGEPQLLWLLPVANIWLIIQGLESLQPFVRNKELKPGLGLKMQLITQVVGSVFSIVGALVYPSPWALVGGLLAGAFASTIASHLLAGELLPKPRLSLDFLRDQWKLASWLILSTMLGFFGGQIDRLIFPAWYGSTAFGIYSVALTLALFPLQLGQRWADTVYMPAIAKLSQAHSQTADEQLRVLARTVVVYGAVASSLLAGLGTPFFHALYPRRFALAGAFVQILAVTTYSTFITYLHRRTFLYQGMTRVEASIEAARLFLFLAALTIAVVVIRKPSTLEYVSLYAIVQIVVYGGLMVVGRIRHLVHFRDDLPGHTLFSMIFILMILVGDVVELRFGAVAALLINCALGGGVVLAIAARLGLPKLPSAHGPEPPSFALSAGSEFLDPIRET